MGKKKVIEEKEMVKKDKQQRKMAKKVKISKTDYHSACAGINLTCKS